jgi:hypothetical protein
MHKGPGDGSLKLENDFHAPFAIRNLGGMGIFPFLADWIRDALAGAIPPGHRREVLVPEKQGLGPYEPQTSGLWFPGRALGKER